MENRILRRLAAVGRVALLALAVGTSGSMAQEPAVTVPEPGVPELFTLEGEFVRVAYNNEGYVSLGYRMANRTVGEEWMLLDMGVTLRRGVEYQTLKRGALSLDIVPPALADAGRERQPRAVESRASLQPERVEDLVSGSARGVRGDRHGVGCEIQRRGAPHLQGQLASLPRGAGSPSVSRKSRSIDSPDSVARVQTW